MKLKFSHIFVLCVAIFCAARVGWLAILVVIAQVKTRDLGDLDIPSPTEILIVKAKIDDADCSLSLAVASKNATDQDYINLLPRVENNFRNAVAYVFMSKEHAVYPRTATGGFTNERNLSRVVGVVTCNTNGYQEVVRYEPNMWTGKPRVLLAKSSRN